MEITSRQLNILRHAIGYGDEGNDRYPNARSLDERRNRFVTDPNDGDGRICQSNVTLGLMHDHGPQSMAGGMHCYTVTEQGRAIVLQHKPVSKKLTRSQRRYQDFLRADLGVTFREYLRIIQYEKRRQKYMFV